MSNRKKRDERAARAAQMRKERERAEARRGRLIVGGIVAAVVVIVVAAGAAIYASEQAEGTPPEGATDKYGYVYSAETIDSDQATSSSEPVKVVLYEDFICPACGSFEGEVGSYIEDQVTQGNIAVEYRPIAFLDDASTTDYSTRAANAAACVFDDEGVKVFHRFHDLLFENQPPEGGPGLSDSELDGLAQQAGAGGVDSCIESGEYEGWVAEANDQASQDNITQTPTVIVGGKRVQAAAGGVPTLQDLVSAIAEARSKQ